MLYQKINFAKTVRFLGRNGVFKCTGVQLTATQDDSIMIEPVNSKNEIGRALIEIPNQDLPAFIEGLRTTHLENAGPLPGTIIYSATIDHKHGQNHYFAKSEYGLSLEVFTYVNQNWADEMPEDLEMPILVKDAIELYFNTMDERLGEEFISYNQTPFDSIPD